MARIEMIIATEQDGLKTRTIAIPCKIHIGNPNFSLADAVRNAVKEYLHTEEGKETYGYNCRCFNWADFDVHVPNSICLKYGFEKMETSGKNLTVDWDEQLADEAEFDEFWQKEA